MSLHLHMRCDMIWQIADSVPAFALSPTKCLCRSSWAVLRFAALERPHYFLFLMWLSRPRHAGGCVRSGHSGRRAVVLVVWSSWSWLSWWSGTLSAGPSWWNWLLSFAHGCCVVIKFRCHQQSSPCHWCLHSDTVCPVFPLVFFACRRSGITHLEDVDDNTTGTGPSILAHITWCEL